MLQEGTSFKASKTKQEFKKTTTSHHFVPLLPVPDSRFVAQPITQGKLKTYLNSISSII